MKNSILYIILILMIVMTSCTEGLYNQLIWPSEDPLVKSPNVLSFSEVGVIKISWEKDWAAEEYILYKKPVNSLAAPVQIYRGTELEYIDDDFPGLDGSSEVLYHYTLSKIRGTRAFGPSDPSLGIYSENIEDGYEPNNSMTEAWELSNSRVDAKLYYFRDSYNNVVKDEDWYCVEIKPNFIGNVVLNAKLGESAFKYQIYRQSSVEITIGEAFEIPNNSNEKRKIYFKILPSASSFMNDDVQNGGALKPYTLHYIQENSSNPE